MTNIRSFLGGGEKIDPAERKEQLIKLLVDMTEDVQAGKITSLIAAGLGNDDKVYVYIGTIMPLTRLRAVGAASWLTAHLNSGDSDVT